MKCHIGFKLSAIIKDIIWYLNAKMSLKLVHELTSGRWCDFWQVKEDEHERCVVLCHTVDSFKVGCLPNKQHFDLGWWSHNASTDREENRKSDQMDASEMCKWSWAWAAEAVCMFPYTVIMISLTEASHGNRYCPWCWFTRFYLFYQEFTCFKFSPVCINKSLKGFLKRSMLLR